MKPTLAPTLPTKRKCLSEKMLDCLMTQDQQRELYSTITNISFTEDDTSQPSTKPTNFSTAPTLPGKSANRSSRAIATIFAEFAQVCTIITRQALELEIL